MAAKKATKKPARKAPAKKTVAKKAPVKPAKKATKKPARKAPAKKAVAKKAPAARAADRFVIVGERAGRLYFYTGADAKFTDDQAVAREYARSEGGSVCNLLQMMYAGKLHVALVKKKAVKQLWGEPMR